MRRLERGRRGAARDVVLELVERVTHRELRGDLGDREPGGLRGQRRGARHARIHLDDQQAAVLRVHGELHVRAAGIDADLAQHRDRRVAHALVFLVGERLRRRDGDRIAGVHAHRIEVLDGADDDAVVVPVANDLHLEFLPADHRFFDEHFGSGRGIEPALDDLLEFLAVVGDAAARAAHGERRADHAGETHGGLDLVRLRQRVRHRGARTLEADLRHGIAEQLAVLGHVDGLAGCRDELHAVFGEHAFAHQVERRVQRRLAAHGGQQRVGFFLLDDARQRAPVDGLDVDRVGHLRVGHDGRGIRIHQDDAVALLLERLAGLRAGIVELARLADDDGAGADDQDAFDVCTFWHESLASALRRLCRAVAACRRCGPGASVEGASA